MKAHIKNEPYENLSIAVEPSVLIRGDLGGLTLLSGIYKSMDSLHIQAGDLTLDGQGNEHAVWIFEIATDLLTVGGAGGNVILRGGARSKNVFWKLGHKAILGEGTSFKGNILSKMMDEETEGASDTGIAAPLSVKNSYAQAIFNRKDSVAWPIFDLPR